MLLANDLTTNTHEFAVVTVHTWAQAPRPARVTTQPAESWLDGVHGPVLDGVFLSTPALVALLVGLIGVALVMAARAAGAANPTTPFSSRPAPPASNAERASGVSLAGGH